MFPYDIFLTFNDGRKLGTYKSLLYLSCPLFRTLFTEYPDFEGPIIVSENINYETFEEFLKLLKFRLLEVPYEPKIHPLDMAYLRSYLLLSPADLETLRNVIIQDQSLLDRYTRYLASVGWNKASLSCLISSLKISPLKNLSLNNLPICQISEMIRVNSLIIRTNTGRYILPLDGYSTIPYKIGKYGNVPKELISDLLYYEYNANQVIVEDIQGNLIVKLDYDVFRVYGKDHFASRGKYFYQLDPKSFLVIDSLLIDKEITSFLFSSEYRHVCFYHAIDNSFSIWNFESKSFIQNFEYPVREQDEYHMKYCGDYFIIKVSNPYLDVFSIKDNYSHLWSDRCSNISISPSKTKILVDGRIINLNDNKMLFLVPINSCFGETDDHLFIYENDVILRFDLNSYHKKFICKINEDILYISTSIGHKIISPEYHSIYEKIILSKNNE